VLPAELIADELQQHHQQRVEVLEPLPADPPRQLFQQLSHGQAQAVPAAARPPRFHKNSHFCYRPDLVQVAPVDLALRQALQNTSQIRNAVLGALCFWADISRLILQKLADFGSAGLGREKAGQGGRGFLEGGSSAF
jgi:hypothetical protein